MILKLDQNQRLNLVALLDSVEAVGRREAFAVCRLQERLDLSEAEREEIGWRKIKAQDGRELVAWSNNGAIRTGDYDLAEDDIRRISAALDKYPVVLGRDKHWWTPLAEQLPAPPETEKS